MSDTVNSENSRRAAEIASTMEENRPVLGPDARPTIWGKNPQTPEMVELADIAARQRLESDGSWTSERVSPSDGHSETLEMFNKAVEAALKNPQIVKTIEDRAEGAKQAYEYFLGPQQYWRFTYKGRIYSLCSASNTPIDLQAILDKIDNGSLPSEPEPACDFSISDQVSRELHEEGLRPGGRRVNGRLWSDADVHMARI